MCLDMRIKKTDKRIKNPIIGKKYIICYSKAQKASNGRYYPVWCNRQHSYNSGWSKSFLKRESCVLFGDTNRHYIPHFHRFRSIEDVRNYYYGDVILKWLVPVDSITTVGLQNDRIVVITNRCKLLGEVK